MQCLVDELFVGFIFNVWEWDKVLDCFWSLVEVGDDGVAVLEGFGLFSCFLGANTYDFESTFDMNSSLIVIDLMSCTKCSHSNK